MVLSPIDLLFLQLGVFFQNVTARSSLNTEAQCCWAHLLLKCTGFVQRKAITATSKYIEANFEEVKARARYLNGCYEGCHPRTNHKLESDRNKDGPIYKTNNREAAHKMCGASRDENRRQITAVLCRMTGDFLPIQLIHQGMLSLPPSLYTVSLRVGMRPTWSKHWSTEKNNYNVACARNHHSLCSKGEGDIGETYPCNHE